MAEEREKTYEVFGFDRVKKPGFIHIVPDQYKSGYLAIGFPSGEGLMGFVAGIETGIFGEKKMEGENRPVFFMSYQEVIDLIDGIPQIIADNADNIRKEK